MKKYVVCCLVLLVKTASSQSFNKTPLGVSALVKGHKIELQCYSPGIVRVLKYPQHESFSKTSLSVIKKPTTVPLKIRQEAQRVIVGTTSIEVSLDLQTAAVSFALLNGKHLLAEKEGAHFKAITDVNKSTYKVKQAFALDKDEVIYGLGQQQNGKMNQRNQEIFLRQDNMKVCIPFFQSVKGYGIFWDNYSPTTFSDHPAETVFDSQVGDCVDYYFMWGGSGDGVVAKMRDLTGQAPLMPLWTYGFNQSRERYKTQYELVEVVKKYRSLNIPLDGIIQDWRYWGKDSNWNAMSFDPASFPAPKAMVDSVHQLNAHLFIVAWPGVGPLTKLYAEYKAGNMLLDFETWPPNSGTRPYDVYSPLARDLYWNYLNKGVFQLDTDAWWLDSSEPDHVNLKETDFDLPTHLGSFRSVRNAFPLQHVGGVYDHQRKTTSAKRVSILTRSAFAGQQRYGANTWSGDVRSDWQTFRKQIPAGLNFSLCGIPYWNTDIGGFFAGSFNAGGGARNPEFRELYTRWMQFATFTPMMRSHGTDIPREIYQFGQAGEPIFNTQEKFIRLRYSLLPYIYSTAWQVTAQAGSIMRALFMDFSNDKKACELDNEFLFGNAFLVAPVTEKGKQSQAIYLPAGTDWYDFWTGEVLKGGATVEKETPIDIMPLYVKAGAIVPWGPQVQHAAEKKWDNLEMRIYPGANGNFTLYEDENDNYNYEKGSYNEISFSWNNKNRTLAISNRKGSFPGMLSTRKFNIVLVNSKQGTGPLLTTSIHKTVSYTGKALTVKL